MGTGDSLVTLAVAFLCILALGTSATALESAVSTHPDDVIDVDYDRIPIGKDQGRAIKESVTGESNRQRSSGGDRESSGGGRGTPSSASSDPGTGTPESSGGEEGGSGGSMNSGEDGDSGGAGSEMGLGQSGTGQNEGPGPGTFTDKSLLDWLLSLLRMLLPLLAALLVIALLYRYRERIRAFLLALFGGVWSAGESADSSPRPEPWGSVDPSNPVYRAWLGMARRLDLERPHAKTAEEFEDAALDAGMDPEAVGTLTSAFRDVRYGDREIDSGQRRRVERSARQLGLDGGTR